MSAEASLITSEILQEVVSKDLQRPVEEVEILNYDCSHGSNKGENFTCVLVISYHQK